MACGRPILGTNIGGIPEIVVVEASALVEGIKWFINNQDKIIAMGNNGRDQMKKNLSWEQYKINDE